MKRREQHAVDRIIGRQQPPHTTTRYSDSQSGYNRSAPRIRRPRNCRGLMGEDRALVLRHPHRAVKRRGAVAIKVHERVHAVWIEGHETPARPQHAMPPRRSARVPAGDARCRREARRRSLHRETAGARRRLRGIRCRDISRASSISFGLISIPVQRHPCRRRSPLNTPEPQPRSATRAPGKLAEPDDRADQAGAAFRLEHVIGVGRRVAVEKRDFLALVLGGIRSFGRLARDHGPTTQRASVDAHARENRRMMFCPLKLTQPQQSCSKKLNAMLRLAELVTRQGRRTGRANRPVSPQAPPG